MQKGRFGTRQSTQESERRQGEFSGMYDKSGHHLKSDGTHDMRFIENREGEGYSSQRATSQERRTSPRRRFGTSSRSKGRRGKSFAMRRKGSSAEQTKSDGTPDMRFKENREEFAGQGFEGTTSRSTRISKADAGIYEGNVPGEHIGFFDEEGHHLKSDGTPDMRFRENRDEFTGQGYESERDEKGNTRRRAKYQSEGEFTEHKIYKRKRPPTPYALYIKERASEMKRENPDMDMNEVFRELADIWNDMEQSEKDKYYQMYDEEVKNYEEARPGLLRHRGPLSLRKAQERFGISGQSGQFGRSSRGKYSSRYRKPRMSTQETEDDSEEDDFEEEEV
jgi:hypothetical protein